MIIVKEGDVNIGANPSAEEAEEAMENGAAQVNNIVHSHRLHATSFDKKSYLTYLKVRTRTLFFVLNILPPIADLHDRSCGCDMVIRDT